MTVESLNALGPDEAEAWFTQLCTAQKWCGKMVESMPYTNKSSLVAQAKMHWNDMQEDDFLEAFQGHPMIGDINTLREKYASTKALASNEQSGTAGADEGTLNALHKANHEYLDKNGFIFIICASGLSAKTMLDALDKRLQNSRPEEIEIAAQEQLKISLLRIDKAMADE
ncbi:MAG: 2-oxo-4-hydroxy-4-carboxy-5-ureidoimidazoline decarboxylase [Pseudomonadota bacterium]